MKTKHFFNLSPEITLYEPSFNRKRGKWNKVTTYIKLLLWIRKTVKLSKPDVVLVYGDYFAPMVLFALLGTKTPKFISDRMDPNLNFPLSIHMAKKWLYPTASGMIAQTQKAAQINQQKFGNKLKIEVIPNAVKPFLLQPVKKKKQILSLSRLHPEKGLDLGIAAFAQVHAPDWKWLVAGAGTEAEFKKYQNLINSLGLHNKFILLGEVKEVQTLLNESAIFVLPSKSEGFPNALCEAMAAGLICITFEHLNDSNIITSNDFDGVVLKEYEPEVLARNIEKVIHDIKKYENMSLNSKLITDRLNVKNIINKIEFFIFS